LNSLKGGSSGTATAINSNFMITEIGGIAVRVYNVSGMVLPEGYLVRASEASTENSVTMAREDEYDISGSVYHQIPIGGIGYMVTHGWADVWFNANGSVARGYFAMSRTNDTVNTDHGKAQCGTITKPDTIRILGWVYQARSGEGLARCLWKK
jgi:hypothetical protein